MRLFVGVDLPAPAWEEPPPSRDASPSHLTLLFLGDVDDDRVPGLAARFGAALAPEAPFEVELRGLGAFPSRARPRILWAGVGDGAVPLARLSDSLRAAAGSLAPTEDRPFQPHLTLLRIRGPRDADRARAAIEREGTRVFSRTPVTEVLLKSSELRREGAIHRVVARFPLRGDPGEESRSA